MLFLVLASGNVFKCLGEIFKRMKHITLLEMPTFQTKYWQIKEYPVNALLI